MTLTIDNTAALAAADRARAGNAEDRRNIRRIRIIKGTVCGGRIVAPGWVIDASLADARILVGSNKAEFADGAELNTDLPKEKTAAKPGKGEDK